MIDVFPFASRGGEMRYPQSLAGMKLEFKVAHLN